MKFNRSRENAGQREKNALEKAAQRIRSVFEKSPKEKEPETETENREENEELSNFTEEGFDVYEELKRVKGPYIEVAGPTEAGYKLVDLRKLEKKLIVSGRAGSGVKTDFEADATHLPMKDESVGALFVSGLGGRQKDDPEELNRLQEKIDRFENLSKKEIELYGKLSYESKRRLRNAAIQEAYRVLEDKGLLIWQSGSKEDYEKALELGFKIMMLRDARTPGVATRGVSYNFIFEKEKLESGKSSDSASNTIQ